jgi:GTP-binding protein HflX
VKQLAKQVNINNNPQSSSSERAVLVHLNFSEKKQLELTEFIELTRSAGALSVAVVTGKRLVPDAKYFVGKGKAAEIQQQVIDFKATLVLFDHVLTPSQQRNLEKLVNVRVVDRTSLILDIFAQRARTFEGKLQVELAQLQHLATRLVRGWTHLERQKGGIGLRGPGETQLEVDRRLIRNRIKTIKSRLEDVRAQREQSRRARHRAEISTVALVGYTNTGKSTLFNLLTQSNIHSANLLFATLDPTLRRIQLPQVGATIMADTVGFIRELPHDLVEAFKATLEETKQADLLLHVIDTHQVDRAEAISAVETVLQQIEADTLPCLQVYNKIDLVLGTEPHLDRDSLGRPCRVWISAEKGLGIDLLKQALVELLGSEMVSCALVLAPDEGKLRANLYAKNAVVNEENLPEGGWRLEVRLPTYDYEQLIQKIGKKS